MESKVMVFSGYSEITMTFFPEMALVTEPYLLILSHLILIRIVSGFI